MRNLELFIYFNVRNFMSSDISKLCDMSSLLKFILIKEKCTTVYMVSQSVIRTEVFLIFI